MFDKTVPLPGLPVSRTLGHSVGNALGVIPDPEITHVEISKSDKFLILGSDGLWAVLSSIEAVTLVSEVIQTTLWGGSGITTKQHHGLRTKLLRTAARLPSSATLLRSPSFALPDHTDPIAVRDKTAHPALRENDSRAHLPKLVASCVQEHDTSTDSQECRVGIHALDSIVGMGGDTAARRDLHDGLLDSHIRERRLQKRRLTAAAAAEALEKVARKRCVAASKPCDDITAVVVLLNV